MKNNDNCEEFLNGLLTVYSYEYIDEAQVLDITRDNDIPDETVLDFVHYLNVGDFEAFKELCNV
jgi:hypothetical protein